MVLFNKNFKGVVGTFLTGGSLQERKDVTPDQKKDDQKKFDTDYSYFNSGPSFTQDAESNKSSSANSTSGSIDGLDSGLGASYSVLPKVRSMSPKKVKEMEQQSRNEMQPELIARTQDPIKLPLVSVKSAELLKRPSKKEGYSRVARERKKVSERSSLKK